MQVLDMHERSMEKRQALKPGAVNNTSARAVTA